MFSTKFFFARQNTSGGFYCLGGPECQADCQYIANLADFVSGGCTTNGPFATEELCLASCSASENATPEPTATPTSTPEPTVTATPEPTATPTSTPEPTLYSVTAVGGLYYINGSSNPTLTLKRGQIYTFNVNVVGHPFWIKTNLSTGTTNTYNIGVTSNGAQNGNIIWTVASGAPSTLYYNCQYHSGMRGIINVV